MSNAIMYKAWDDHTFMIPFSLNENKIKKFEISDEKNIKSISRILNTNIYACNLL